MSTGARGGVGGSGGGGVVFEPCWICNERTHKRKDCPSKGKITTRNHGADKKVICFGCRQPGHSLRQCRAARTTATTCFNCGSTGHNLSACPAPRSGAALKFATCFVCKQPGHISRDCPKNTAGVYVRGGRCMKCGSTRHYASECGGGDGEDTGGDGEGEGPAAAEAGAAVDADTGAAVDALEPEAPSPLGTKKKDKLKKKKKKEAAAGRATAGEGAEGAAVGDDDDEAAAPKTQDMGPAKGRERPLDAAGGPGGAAPSPLDAAGGAAPRKLSKDKGLKRVRQGGSADGGDEDAVVWKAEVERGEAGPKRAAKRARGADADPREAAPDAAAALPVEFQFGADEFGADGRDDGCGWSSAVAAALGTVGAPLDERAGEALEGKVRKQKKPHNKAGAVRT